MRIASRFFIVLGLEIVFSFPAWAHLIVFKDGFILQGDVRQPGTIVEGIRVAEGTFVLDAGARRVFFPHGQVDDVVQETNPNADLVSLETRVFRLQAYNVDPLLRILDIKPFNDKWRRRFTYIAGDNRPETLEQQISLLNPQYVRVGALKMNWDAYYLTSEFDPDTVRKLIVNHPTMQKKDDVGEAGRRFRIYRFFVQAGWYAAAEEELNRIAAEFPNEKERIAGARENLYQLRVDQHVDDIERAYRVGRHGWAQKQLAEFPMGGVDEKYLTRIRALQSRYHAAQEVLEESQRLLKELSAQVKDSDSKVIFDEAAAAILNELRIDDCLPAPPGRARSRSQQQGKIQRLDSFLSLAGQAERDRKQGRQPTNSPSELLSLAISGWLLGKDAAETNYLTAQKLWQSRQFVLKYQKTPDPDDRAQLLKNYQAIQSRALAPDEMAQLLSLLPPPDPEADIPQQRGVAGGNAAELPATSTEATELETKLPGKRKGGIRYLLQLPPEYHHGRSCPVLIALTQAGEKPRNMLENLSDLAAKSGYMLVVPDWQQRGVAYHYSSQEHATVMDVLVDLRRRFQVDSDRVFLLGNGEGGSMALDLGLAHPDLFAGVIPINPAIKYFVRSYWRNGQYLPFYIVVGDQTGDINKNLFDKFKKDLVPRGFPWLLVQYKGRGLEWFQGELPFIFDWMEHKRDRYSRTRAVPELGKLGGSPSLDMNFQSMRKTDDRYYWLSTKSIPDRQINDPTSQSWNSNVSPATFQGNVFLENNSISVTVRNLKQVTVWLARDMIDFTRPANITVNGVNRWMNKKIEPSLSALMEDFYARGDRQRIYFARVDIDRP
jgi:pimeloyl-ACP methyl ester carboxylesterase